MQKFTIKNSRYLIYRILLFFIVSYATLVRKFYTRSSYSNIAVIHLNHTKIFLHEIFYHENKVNYSTMYLYMQPIITCSVDVYMTYNNYHCFNVIISCYIYTLTKTLVSDLDSTIMGTATIYYDATLYIVPCSLLQYNILVF